MRPLAKLTLLVFAASCLAVTAEPSRILFLTQSKGFAHRPVKREGKPLAPAEIALTNLGEKSGLFTVDCTQDASDITKESLSKYDIVAFYTTGARPIEKEDFSFLQDTWLREKGRGFIGFHSATDTYKEFEPYWDMIGGSFNGHPWGQNTVDVITVHDTSHPAAKPYGPEFTFQDEIYQYRNWQPEKVRVLMSLNIEKCRVKRPYHVPVAWVKEWGNGKMFYTNLGHRNETWLDKNFQESILGAVRWIRGEEAGDATPNPEVSQAEHEKAIKASNEAGMTVEFLENLEKERAERRRQQQQRNRNRDK